MEIDFKVPEFDDDEKWELKDGERGVTGAFFDPDGKPPRLIERPLNSATAGQLIGIFEQYRWKPGARSKHPAVRNAGGKVLKIFGVRIMKWWGLGGEEPRARVVWSGKCWVWCPSPVMALRSEVELKDDEKGGKYVHRFRMHVIDAQSAKRIFFVTLERNGEKEEGKIVPHPSS